MNILVLNSGSSSLKLQLIDIKKQEVLFKAHIDGISLRTCFFKYNNNKQKIKIRDHEQAIKTAINKINELFPNIEINAIGHRVVHGGEKYENSVIINNEVIKTISKLSSLAPLHNPANLLGIVACRKLFPKIKQIAVFDTAFHQTIPKESFLYAIPEKYYKKYKIRRYGFHGTSHQYLLGEAKKILKKTNLNIITCHLGNGSSVCAIKNNISIDTSMGFTPLEGVIMGTRSGSIDPAITQFICEKENKNIAEVINILNKESGLKALAKTQDVRLIREKMFKGNKKCKLALEMLSISIASYIAKYIMLLGKVDAIIFSAGIGEQGYYTRSRICDYLSAFNISYDKKKNNLHTTIFSTANSKVKLLIIPTNEELMIAMECLRLVGNKG